MPRDAEPAHLQRDFVLAALKASPSLRVDGRTPLQARQPEFTFGDDLGWVECQMGKTRVIAQVVATMARPRPDRPYEGTLTIHSELSPMASPAYEAGRASDEEVLITRMLDKVLRRSDCVDREALCILAGQRVWALRLTLHFLSDDGNMLDCACLAGIVALRHFRRPDVEVIGQDVTVHPPEERAPVPLSMHHTPICVTFAFLEESLPILDPNHLESQLSVSQLSLALTPTREICTVFKNGGVALPGDEIMRLVGIAAGRAKEIGTLIDLRLKEDWGGRVVEVQ